LRDFTRKSRLARRLHYAASMTARATLGALLIATIAIASTGCGVGSDEAIGVSCAPIVGGNVDAEHVAVVAVLDLAGKLLCSATLVGTSQGRSAFLSAAHCLDFEPTHVAVGSDYGSPEQLLPVAGALTDPAFDHATGSHDFALIRTDEAARDLAPMRLARHGSREVRPGSQVRFVGFGSHGQEAMTSRARHEVLGTVDAVSADSFEYAQAQGGPCLGDSGGPALGVGADADVLLGVTSYGDHGCHSRGTSARIQAAHDFLARELDEPPPACGD
jgi:hypothetical protein